MNFGTTSSSSINSISPIVSLVTPTRFTGDRDHFIDLGHSEGMAVANGTVAVTFTASSVSGTRALFSKDGRGYDDGGHLSVYIQNGIIKVRQQTDDHSEYLRLSDYPIEAGELHQLSISFGDDGLKVYLDGVLAAAEPEIQQGLVENTRAFLVGASGSHRSTDDQRPNAPFEGEISQFALYDQAFDPVDMAALAGLADPVFEINALASLSAADLLPAFQQLHHGSDTLKALAMQNGIGHDGTLMAGTAIVSADGTFDGTEETDAVLGDLNDDQISGNGGNDILQGFYGNDTLDGGDGNDVLDGGHGEDILRGGAGNDLLISQADGREPFVTFDPDRDEGDPFNELDPETGKLYADQPIPADDILIGGAGADTFYFQTLINAKKRFIEEHTKDDGTIRWHGVAGENDNIHDHWVDEIGNDVIMDFSRADGDQIIIEGHTTRIASVTHGDANGDGTIDHSLIQLYSDQGRGGGAHNDDLLGTITVYGDLITENDIIHTAKPAYGIVTNIDQLEEALSPITISQDTGAIAPPDNLPTASSINSISPIVSLVTPTRFTGDRDHFIDLGHSEGMAVANGTVAVTFTASSVSGTRALFSKDGRGYDDGGHLSVYIQNGIIKVRQQTDDHSEYLRLSDYPIEAGELHQLSISFGDDGLKVYLDGVLAAAEPEIQQGLVENTRAFLVGASGSHRSTDDQRPNAPFEGEISQFALYDQAFDPVDMAALAGLADPAFEINALASLSAADLLPAFQQLHHGSDTLKALAMQNGIGHDGALMAGTAIVSADGTFDGTEETDAVLGDLNDDQISGNGGNDILQGFYGNDTLDGGDGNDVLDGGHGEDILRGGAGNDLLISQADGREPFVTFDPDRDEGDPFNELDPETGKLYADQPIPADDILIGGAGADTFYFQTLINAKKRFIEEHTKDDGTIRWHGVAGENDNIHDHWVDEIGNDVIMDFSRADGDQIIIEGHTTRIASVTHGDANGDGTIDHSLIQLYSDQGRGGGAHNDDLLGTITVYGDLITENDIIHTAKPAYGIVTNIGQLEEALSPITISQDTGAIAPPDNLPTVEPVNGLSPVFAVAGETSFDGQRDSELAFEHAADLALSEGTVSFSFVAENITGWDVLFSKDARNFGTGGHTTAFVGENGDLKVRVQNEDKSIYLRAKNVIEEGVWYDFAFTFGDNGVQLFLDGIEVATDTEFEIDWTQNEEFLLIGANGWASDAGDLGRPSHHFTGIIDNFSIIDQTFVSI